MPIEIGPLIGLIHESRIRKIKFRVLSNLSLFTKTMFFARVICNSFMLHYEPRGKLGIPITRVGALVQEVTNTRRLLPSKATVLRARWVSSYEEYVLAHYCRAAPDFLNDGVMLADRMVNFERKRGKYQYVLP